MNRRPPDGPRSRADSVRVVMDCLRQIVRGLRLSARAAERKAGISGAQLFVLQALGEERAHSMNELAERTCTDQSSVSVVVRRLVEQKLVVRKPSSADARKVELQLTPAGRALLRRCPEPTQARLLAGLQRMPAADLIGLRGGLDALVREVGIEGDTPRMFFDEEDAEPRPPRRGDP